MSRRTTDMSHIPTRTKPPTVQIVSDGHDMFVVADGVRIAKRGRPGTPQAKTWVSLEPGWSVQQRSPSAQIIVEINGVRVH